MKNSAQIAGHLWLLLALAGPLPVPAASPAPAPARQATALRIVGPAGEPTPVVNEGNQIRLSVRDASGQSVAVRSWQSGSQDVAAVSGQGVLKGKQFGFATITARTAQGDTSAFVVVVRVGRRPGAMTQGDTKTDTAGRVYLSSPRDHVIYRASGRVGEVFAGERGTAGYRDGAGAQARFNAPAGLGVDNRAEGGIYVADTENHCIRKVDFRGRATRAIGVAGTSGMMAGDETPMAGAMLAGPRGVAAVGGNLFITDTENHAIYYADFQRGVVRLVAGQPGVAGQADGRGRDARFNRPTGLTVNTRGNLLAVADTGNNVVRLVAIRSEGGDVVGEASTLGVGSSARGAEMARQWTSDEQADRIPFEGPVSVSFDGVENVYVIDSTGASVVTRSRGRVERVGLAQAGSLGRPLSVVTRGTSVLVLDDAAPTAEEAVRTVEVGAPVIDQLPMAEFPIEGGVPVTITGQNFAPESVVTLGDAEVTNPTIESATSITLVVPPQRAAGVRTLTISTRGGVTQVPFSIRAKSIDQITEGQITTVVGSIPYPGDGARSTHPTVRFESNALTMDGAGNIYIPDQGNHRIRRVDVSTGIITTVAGSGTPGFSGDGGPAIAASLRGPSGVRVDAAGNLFIADRGNNRIRRVDAVTGIITTVAGTGEPGFGGDGGPATGARLRGANAVAFDAVGNLFITDTSNRRIRRVDAATGVITTVAGNGQDGFDGDGGPATAASFRILYYAVAFDAEGNFFVSDALNFRVRRVDAATGIVSTVAGIGVQEFSGDGGPATQAGMKWPAGLSFDAAGNLFVADQESHRIRRVDAVTSRITTVAGIGEEGFGGDQGPATAARLNYPNDVVVDGAGNLLIADWYNNRVRRVDAGTGRIETVVGGDLFLGDGGPAADAVISSPRSLVLDAVGNLYIADYGYNRIRMVEADTGPIRTVAGDGRPTYTGDGTPATQAGFYRPTGIALDAAGNLFIATEFGQRVLRVDEATRIITSVAGNGTFDPVSGEGSFSGDGGPAVEAGLSTPSGVAVDGAGNLFIADSFNNRIRRVDAAGTITTAVGINPNGCGNTGDGGPATAAEMCVPISLVFDGGGNLFIADHFNHCVRRVDAATGTITTVAGTGRAGFGGDGGPATAATLRTPVGMAFDGAGNLFIADRGNHRIRRVDAATGTITTVAGTGNRGYEGDGDAATSADLAAPSGIAIDRDGNLLVADSNNFAIRVVKGVAVPVPQTAPRIDGATYAKPQLVITGVRFGATGAVVRVNGEDVSAFVRSQIDTRIELRGSPKKLKLVAGPNRIVVTVGGVTSNAFVLSR